MIKDFCAAVTRAKHARLTLFLVSALFLLAQEAKAQTVIDTVKDLESITNLSGNYVLGADIIASGSTIVPIGSPTNPFDGTFNGEGHTISNLSVAAGNGSYAGLFGVIGPSGVVDNINLLNASITGGGSSAIAGSLAGENQGAIANVSANVSASVAQGTWIGGLVGYNQGTILQSSTTGTVTTPPVPPANIVIAGGLVGYNVGTVQQSSWTAAPSSSPSQLVPGLVGYNEPYGFNPGSGPPSTGIIANSYALGPITGAGIVTSYNQGGLVANSYATGGTGLVGINYQGGTVSNSYWVTDSGQTAGDGSTSITTTNIKSGLPSGLSPAVWGHNSLINNGYPYLLSVAPNSLLSNPAYTPPSSAPSPNFAAIAAIVQQSVQPYTTRSDLFGQKTQVVATFSPNTSTINTLSEAEAQWGLSGFEWISTITKDPAGVLSVWYPGGVQLPFPDPPPGGYPNTPYHPNYQQETDKQYPFYYDINTLATSAQYINNVKQPIYGTDFLTFADLPVYPGLLPGQYVDFTTYLVGICEPTTMGCTQFQGYSLVDLFSFTWETDYNALTGGVAITSNSNDIPGDPGGTGGITILSEDFPLNNTPLPPTLPMLLSGLIGLGYVSRRGTKKRRASKELNLPTQSAPVVHRCCELIA